MTSRARLMGLLLCVSLPAWAQDAEDAGASDTTAAASSPFTSIPKSVDEGTASLDFPGNLPGGSDVAAGLDTVLVNEIVHPSNLSSFAAALRSLGAPFQEGSTSAGLQFNPYLIFQGNTQLYQQFVAAREASAAERLLQDTAVTAVTVPGTPYSNVTYEDGRFFTVAAGAATELLGQRSIYGPVYQKCFEGVQLDPEVGRMMLARPVVEPKRPDESDDVASARMAREQQSRDEADQRILARVGSGMEACASDTQVKTMGLFASVGGRWVVPGRHAQTGDGLAIQRGFAALSFDWLSGPGFEVAVQARTLFERLAPNQAMSKWLDGGASLALTGKPGLLRLEYVRSFLALSGSTTQNRAVLTLTGKLNVYQDWSVGMTLQGRGTDESKALESLTLGVVISFADTPRFTRTFSL